MDLPSASKPSLVLAQSCLDEYNITPWILIDDAAADSRRPVLSSCQTLPKRALVSACDGLVRDVCAHGVANVFTSPEFRRRGYARRMLELLGHRLAEREARQAGDATFSLLFSDIGKRFYADLGWMPFQSTHLLFPVKPSASAAEPSAALEPILDVHLPAIAKLDEQVLRSRLARPPADPAKTRVAILPDLDTFQWDFAREASLSAHLFSRIPAVHGAIYTPPGASNSRVWALWSRVQRGGKEHLDENVLYFLRFVVEDDGISDEELSKAIRAIVTEAQNEAREWLCTSMHMWNPDERTKKLVASMKDLEAQYVVRETDEIASLRWLGCGSVTDIEWIAIEAYIWC